MNRYSSNDSHSYALGMSLTMEALLHRKDSVKKVILSEKANRNTQLERLLKLCREYDIPVLYDEKTIEKLSAKENCYCIGVFDKFHTAIGDEGHIVLYGFHDFGELGTVLRSAVSFDFRNIVLVATDLDYFDPRCVRASMGSLFHCNIAEYDSLTDYLKEHPDRHIYPFVSRGSKMLQDLKLRKPFSILISQENESLDGLFEEDYSIEHGDDSPISLSIRSSIILQEMYQRKRSR